VVPAGTLKSAVLAAIDEHRRVALGLTKESLPMTAAQRETLKTRLENVIALSRLLERVEASRVVIGADQYRALVRQLGVALQQDMPIDALHAVLGAHPAAAEIYENLHYAQSGLSRATLDRSVNSELLAQQALAKAARRG
jgi:hypothetical protein